MFDALKSFIILSIQEIMQFKSHIAQQHTHLPSDKRAELLSVAIHKHLDQHLTGVDSDYRPLLRHNLLSSTVAKHNYNISQHDVLTSIGTLDLNQDSKTDLAAKWLNASTTINFTYDGLATYLDPSPTVSLPSMPRKISKKTYFTYAQWLSIALVLFLVVVLSVSLFSLLKPHEAPPTLRLIRHYAENEYIGLHNLDRVYLISEITKDDLGHLNVLHHTVPFGIKYESFPFPYETFDYFAVRDYIADKRRGLIGSAVHFNTIITLAQVNDIDPLLLFAIIGQEQAFVPTDSYRATEVLNNPFNVFNSWLTYNTSLNESTQIAINTIKNRLNSRPIQTPPLIWLNGIYAEDENWHVGVRLIYQHLQKIGRENL